MRRIIPSLLAPLLVAMLVAPPSARATGGRWDWPVDPPRSIVRAYLAPPTPYGKGHRGIDIASPDGMLYAPADGTVRFSGVVVDRPVLSIDHGGGVISSYEPVEAVVSKGDAVARGQPVGEVMAGHCSSLCVHVGVRVDGEYVSPLLFFGDPPRSILLPTR